MGVDLVAQNQEAPGRSGMKGIFMVNWLGMSFLEETLYKVTGECLGTHHWNGCNDGDEVPGFACIRMGKQLKEHLASNPTWLADKPATRQMTEEYAEFLCCCGTIQVW